MRECPLCDNHEQCRYRDYCQAKAPGRFAHPPVVSAAPSVSDARKAAPVFSGVLNYFPDALMAVARVSKAGNDKHNPGEPLHWSRKKSADQLDAAARHLLTPFAVDPDSGELHLAHLVWRALAELQLHLEKK